ncbi:endonuclease V [Aquimarina litoralis]|uniref:Endonuclease V n=1 Tax=Aquimarina litoralis TaxID=584605 RepID=A0ABN1J915_9FLAO
MIYCFDTYYFGEKANTACIGISDWNDETVSFEKVEIISGIQEYESGSFYKRELPCILSILDNLKLNSETDFIVIDGYVVLDDSGKMGLGGYLFEHLNQQIPIVGVAKNDYPKIDKMKRKLFRGNSKKALYITAIGIDLDLAAEKILSMHGAFRFPTILKIVDQKSRDIL